MSHTQENHTCPISKNDKRVPYLRVSLVPYRRTSNVNHIQERSNVSNIQECSHVMNHIQERQTCPISKKVTLVPYPRTPKVYDIQEHSNVSNIQVCSHVNHIQERRTPHVSRTLGIFNKFACYTVNFPLFIKLGYIQTKKQ